MDNSSACRVNAIGSEPATRDIGVGYHVSFSYVRVVADKVGNKSVFYDAMGTAVHIS